jgi:hypothetical protein
MRRPLGQPVDQRARLAARAHLDPQHQLEIEIEAAGVEIGRSDPTTSSATSSFMCSLVAQIPAP